MPIAAKFSKEFYAKLGHGIADELVDWFNKVDTTYRSEFRELFQVNFARFDAKLEQRLGAVKADLEQRATQIEAKLEQRLAEIKAELREEISGLRTELHEAIATLRTELREEITMLRAEFRAELSAGLSGLESRLIKWMFVFWVGTLGTVVALIKL
ncbi:MAG: hypothetical protein ACE5HT_11155 [Gemmatimonadales bacterium]